MTSKRIQRIGAMMMALCLVMGMFPMSALAARRSTFTNNVGDYIEYNSNGTPTGQELEESKKVIEEGNLELSKDIEQKGEDTFDITLKVTTTESLENIPMVQDAAVVLMVDTSDSMGIHCGGCGGLISQTTGAHIPANPDHPVVTSFAALKSAAKTFVNNFADPKGEAKRMVALVSYNRGAKTEISWTDATDSENRQAIFDAIDALELANETKEASTTTDAALQLATNLYTRESVAAKIEGINQRSAVLMTDGQPNRWKYDEGNENWVGYNSEDYWPIGSRPGAQEHNSNLGAKNATETAKELKKQATVYTVAYQIANADCYYPAEGGKVTVGNWMKNEIATRPACYRDAISGEQLTFAFEEIAETITNLTAAWKVTDPLGQYILLENVEKLTENTNVHLIKDTLGNITGFDWSLWKETPVEGTNDNGDKTYTYTLTYRVKLDTSAEGFEEETYYPTNGATGLEYILDAVDGEGNLKPNLPTVTDYFNVPTVKGKVPQYGYKIEFYKNHKTKSDDQDDYKIERGKTLSGNARLYSDINAPADYLDMFSNYHFTKSNLTDNAISFKITDNAENNVLRLYYDPNEIQGTVDHYYKTTTLDQDGNKTEGDYALGLTENFKVFQTNNEYEIVPQTSSGNLTYTIDKVVKVSGDGTETTETEIKKNGENKYTVKLDTDADNNYFKVYYSRTQDDRDEATVTVTHHYVSQSWEYNGESGKMELVNSTTTDVKFAEETKKVGELYTTPITANSDHNDYVYKDGSLEGSNKKETEIVDVNGVKNAKMKLNKDSNTIEMTFVKAPTSVPDTMKLVVTHEYEWSKTTLTDNGTPEYDEGRTSKTEDPKTVKAGDSISAYVKEDFDDEIAEHARWEYKRGDDKDVLRGKKVPTKAENNGEDTVHVTLTYKYEAAPEKAAITTHHIFYEAVTKTEPTHDADGVVTGTEEVTVYTQKHKETVNYNDLYVGQYKMVNKANTEGDKRHYNFMDTITVNGETLESDSLEITEVRTAMSITTTTSRPTTPPWTTATPRASATKTTTPPRPRISTPLPARRPPTPPGSTTRRWR